jgi:hypothetical protein
MNPIPTIPNPINGYIFAVVALVMEFITIWNPNLVVLFILAIILAWAYYLWNVHMIHRVVINSIDPSHEITPGKAVGFHFIPVYNLFWLFKWPKELLSVILFNTKDPGFRFGLTLGCIYAGIIFMRFDFAIGFAVFWTGISMMIRALNRVSEAKRSSVSPPKDLTQDSLKDK